MRGGVNMMSFEDVKEVGVKKGDKVRFTNRKFGMVIEGVVVKKTTKTLSGGKYFCGARGRWVDAEPVKRIYLSVKEEDGTLCGEDQFYTLEVIK
jgi:anaerobic selenocysteine-containing dehydrogenase